MKLTGTFQSPRVDFGKYRQALKKCLADAIAQCAVAWLGATTASIPVWSGASRATFQRLASQVGFHLDIAVASGAPDQTDMGLTNSTGSIDVSSADKGLASFKYGTSLAHLIYNEFNNANVSPDPTLFGKLKRPGPYDFQTKGVLALRNALRDLQLPRVSITIKTIKV